MPAPIHVRFDGHLTASVLEAQLATVVAQLAPRPRALLVDCRTMTGYDAEARAAFVAWNRRHADRVSGLAIVTENRLWWMVISAMSMASGRSMKAFETVPAALAWLGDPDGSP